MLVSVGGERRAKEPRRREAPEREQRHEMGQPKPRSTRRRCHGGALQGSAGRPEVRRRGAHDTTCQHFPAATPKSCRRCRQAEGAHQRSEDVGPATPPAGTTLQLQSRGGLEPLDYLVDIPMGNMIHKHCGHDCATLRHFCPFCPFCLVWHPLGRFAEKRVTKQKVNIWECGRSKVVPKWRRIAVQQWKRTVLPKWKHKIEE